jgi:hypothetical protein
MIYPFKKLLIICQLFFQKNKLLIKNYLKYFVSFNFRIVNIFELLQNN